MSSMDEIQMLLVRMKSTIQCNDIQIAKIFLNQNGFEFESLIKAGQFGVIMVAKNSENNEKVAIQMIVLSEIEGINEKINESLLIRRVQSPFIVRFIKQLIDIQHKCLYVVTELCPQGDLHQFKQQNENISKEQIIDLFSEVLKGIMAIHAKEIIHGQLNPQSILLSNDLTAKITCLDLNSRIPFRNDQLGQEEIFPYKSKENCEGKLEIESDYFSAGAILCFLCGLKFEDNSALCLNMKNGVFEEVKGSQHEELLKIAFTMMTTDPKLRQKPQQILDKLQTLKKVSCIPECVHTYGIEDVS